MTRPSIPWPRIFAEGVAIVVSILLAFGIQAWWEGRQEYEAATEHLLALRSDFANNLDSIGAVLSRAETVKAQVRALLRVSEGETARLSSDSLTALTWGAFSYWTFEPLAVAYNNLITTDGVRLLSDDALAEDLAQFYSQVAIYHREDFQTSQWEAMNQPFVNRRLEALDWLPPSYRAEHDLPEPDRRIDWDELLTDGEFEGILVNRFVAANDAVMLISKFRPTAIRVLERVDDQLRSRGVDPPY